DFGGAKGIFDYLQRKGDEGKPEQEYIARHYAPKRTATADYRRERLFYTRENALFLDAVREEIEFLFPVSCPQKNVLLAALLYEAATHVNTSGVFKAYHKGFGGHGGDALKRIMSPMSLEIPALISGPEGTRYEVTCDDASQAASGKSYDLVYLDPPYNCHQYGSNYFMLNTIALWDKPAVDNTFGMDGKLRKKAGIREDWVKTRSPWCSRTSAAKSLCEMLDALDSRYIMMSYNTEGILSVEEQLDIFASRGKIKYAATEYTSYRGGRQSINRKIATTEYVLILDTSKKTRSSDLVAIHSQQQLQLLKSMQANRFNPDLLLAHFGSSEKIQLNHADSGAIVFKAEFEEGYIPISWEIADDSLNSDQVDYLINTLSKCICSDQNQQFLIAINILERVVQSGKRSSVIEKEAAKALRRFTHKKYMAQYKSAVHRVVELTTRHPELKKMSKIVTEIQEIAALRFAG
ncbi:MAG: hypothetical protein D6B26_04720, partial [Spirochaetaceae bacterium]